MRDETINEKRLTPNKAADYVDVNSNRLSQWRFQKKIGSEFIQLGAQILRYKKSMLDEYGERHAVKTLDT